MSNSNGCRACAGFGGIIAALMSYMKWHSVFFGILHFLCGWIYVVYYLLRYGVPQW